VTRNWQRPRFIGANRHLQRRALYIVREALRHGEISREPCVVCGSEEVQGHHEDYAEPLDVIWLCRLHHSWRHDGDTVEVMRAAWAREAA